MEKHSVEAGGQGDGIYDNAKEVAERLQAAKLHTPPTPALTEDDDGAAVTMKLHRYLDAIVMNKAAEVLVCSSGLSNQVQDGMIALYPSISHVCCDSGSHLKAPASPPPAHTEAGVTDAKWLDEKDFLLTSESGGLELWRCVGGGCGDGGGGDPWATGRQLRRLWCKYRHDDVVYGVDISCGPVMNTPVLAFTASGDTTIKLWDLNVPQVIHTVRGHTGIVWCVQCHPSDENLFLSCSQDHRLILWDLRKEKLGLIINNPTRGSAPVSVAWQPGSRFCVGVGTWGGDVSYRDVRMGVGGVISSTTPHVRPVNRVAFNPDNPNTMCSVSDDCSVAMTQVMGDKMEQVYCDSTSHVDMVKGLCWSSGTTCYSCAWDGLVRKHTLTPSN